MFDEGSKEQLQKWVEIQLVPLCDTEPAVLAEYVMELLKRDLETDSTKAELIIHELKDFLNEESDAQGFVDSLFTVMKDKSYIETTNNVQEFDFIRNVEPRYSSWRDSRESYHQDLPHEEDEEEEEDGQIRNRRRSEYQSDRPSNPSEYSDQSIGKGILIPPPPPPPPSYSQYPTQTYTPPYPSHTNFYLPTHRDPPYDHSFRPPPPPGPVPVPPYLPYPDYYPPASYPDPPSFSHYPPPPPYPSSFDSYSQPLAYQPFGVDGRGRERGQGRKERRSQPSLPEQERCTLRVAGIPARVREEDLRKHFLSFGRIVHLQFSPAQHSDLPEEENEEEESRDRKYGECLVQFADPAHAKRCHSSPTPVLNNRFIKLFNSHFNIIPLTDVPPPTLEEEEELRRVQAERRSHSKASSLGADQGGLPSPSTPSNSPGTFSEVRGGGFGGRRGGGRIPLPGRLRNKSFVLGRPEPTPSPSPPLEKEVSQEVHSIVSEEKEDEQEGKKAKTDSFSPDDSQASDSMPVSASDPLPSEGPVPSPPSEVVKVVPRNADLSMHSKYQEARSLKEKALGLLREKEKLIQGHIESIKTMISHLETSSSSSDPQKKASVATLENKLLNFQSKLKEIVDQREKGEVGLRSPDMDSTAGRGRSSRGRGGLGRGGRFGRGDSFFAGHSSFGRGRGRFNQQARGQGRTGPSPEFEGQQQIPGISPDAVSSILPENSGPRFDHE